MVVDQPLDDEDEDIRPMINVVQSTIIRLSEIPKKIIIIALAVVSLIATITSLSVTLGKVPPPTMYPTTAYPSTSYPTTAVPITIPTRKKTAYPTVRITEMPTTDVPTMKPSKKKGG